jgi:HAD superfamily hydrolase (TIGR01509 family)
MGSEASTGDGRAIGQPVQAAKFRVVALDAMGVIYRSADDVTDLLVPYARSLGCRLEEDRILQAYVECSLGAMTSSELWEQLGVAGDDEEYCRGHELTDGVPDALERLEAAGVTLACLSNDVSEWSLLLRGRFGLDRHIRTWVISGDIRVRKPDPRAYDALARALDVAPRDILFVDDRAKNVQAARAAGLNSILYEPTGPVLDVARDAGRGAAEDAVRDRGRDVVRGMPALVRRVEGS